LRAESEGTIELTPLAILADDANVIARGRVVAERAGKRLDTENCYAFRFVDGMVVEGQVFVSDPDGIDDFWPELPSPSCI
jgi:ketosteroid isomerase-like protein